MKDNHILIIPGYRLFPVETGAGVAQLSMIQELQKYFAITVLLDEINVKLIHRESISTLLPAVQFLDWESLRTDWEKAKPKGFFHRVLNKFRTEEKKQFPEFDLPQELQAVWQNASNFLNQKADWRKPALHHHLKKTAYSLVQTDLPVNLPLIDERQKKYSTVHVCHELKHKRFKTAAEQLAVADELWSAAYDYLRSEELKAIEAYDECLVFSKEDAEALPALKNTKVEVSPFPIRDSDFRNENRTDPERLLFLGPENHGPNKEGLEWFLNDILPSIPDKWQLDVVGHWSDETVGLLTSDRIHFHGFVDDLKPFFERSIMIVPILSGAGIRTKILQAMASRVPVLSTRFGAEGIDCPSGLGFFQSADELNEALLGLERQAELQDQVESAFNYVSRNFSQKNLGVKRAQILNSLLSKVED